MPRIATIAPNPSLGLDVSEVKQAAMRAGQRGAESADMIERGVRGLGEGIQTLGDQYGLQHEAPMLANERADTEAKIQLWTDDYFKNADPSDPEITQKYHDQLQQKLEDFGQGTITGPGGRVANEMRGEMLNHFTTVGLSHAANIAAGAAVDAMNKSVNNRTQMVMSDPEQYEYADRALQQDFALQVGVHNLTPEQKVALQEHLTEGRKAVAVAAMRATAEQDPDKLEKDIASGRYTSVVGEAEIKEARAYGLANQHAQAAEQRAADAEQRRQEDDKFKGEMSNFYGNMVRPDGTLGVPQDAPQQLVKLALSPGAQRNPNELKSAMEMVQRITRDVQDGKTIVTDPHTYADFSHRMNLQDDDPHALTYADVNTARAAGQLSDRDHAMFRQAIADNQKDPVKRDAFRQFYKQTAVLKGAITKSNIMSGFSDSAGDQRYAEFLDYERHAMNDHFRKGDWQQWISSGQLAKDAVKFAPAFNANQDMSKPAPYTAPPGMGGANIQKRNPGESLDAWAKRTGH